MSSDRVRDAQNAPTLAAAASSASSTSGGYAPIATGTPRFMMPAFSAAISGSVSPSSSRWSREIEVIAHELDRLPLVIPVGDHRAIRTEETDRHDRVGIAAVGNLLDDERAVFHAH